MADNTNPFNLLRDQGDLKGVFPKGDAASDWALLSWMNRHSEALFRKMPMRPIPDFEKPEIPQLQGKILDNALIGLPQKIKEDLEVAFPLGGNWVRLLSEEVRRELAEKDQSFETQGRRCLALRSLLSHLVTTMMRGGEGGLRELLSGIQERWLKETRNWLRMCLTRAKVKEKWEGKSLAEKRSFHGLSSIESLLWVLGELDASDDFLEILPDRVAEIYRETGGGSGESWDGEWVDSVEELIYRLSGLERDVESKEDFSIKATEVRLKLAELKPQPSIEEVPKVLESLDQLQSADISNRQAIQACTSCLLWLHQSDQEGKAVTWMDGRKIHRWEIQRLLCHHFILNGSVEKARVVFEEMEHLIPPEEKTFLDRLTSI